MATLIFICVALFALITGSFVYSSPERIIDIQKKFYALINWRMEPISMPREIRNTKLLGLFLILFTLISCLYYWLQ
jgi:hypothetical protein